MSHEISILNTDGKVVRTKDYESMLGALKSAGVFEIFANEGEYVIRECCDQYFAIQVTAHQLQVLSAEIALFPEKP